MAALDGTQQRRQPLAPRGTLKTSLDGTALFDARIARVGDLNLPARGGGSVQLQVRELIASHQKHQTLRLERRRRPAPRVAAKAPRAITGALRTDADSCAARV